MKDRLEVAAAVLLSVAAVTTAWSSYQASRWNGEQAKQSGTTNRLRIQAARAEALSDAQKLVDVETFTQWVDAYAKRETELADFYYKRFRAEFKPAMDAWIASKPLTNANAPLTPFAMPQYKVAAEEQAKQLDAQAETSSGLVHRNIQRSTNYVLGVVLCAVALFFAGVSTRFTGRGVRLMLVVVGWIIYLSALTWIATSPVSFSV